MRLVVILASAVLLSACTPNQRIINSSNERPPEPDSVGRTTTVAPARIDDDIAAMRTADFNFIFVFRRKDGGLLDAGDRTFMSSYTPPEINRRKISDGGRGARDRVELSFAAGKSQLVKRQVRF